MNSPAVRFHPAAVRETKVAKAWYGKRSPNAKARLITELDSALQRMIDDPACWPAYLYGTQRVRVTGFPYILIYRTVSDGIQVIALAHTSRKPGYWRKRLKP